MIEIVKLTEHELFAPKRATEGSAGYDLQSAEYIEIPAWQSRVIKTGFMWAIPEGMVGFVCPRSGLAAKHGITVLNGPGVIDRDYRGEIKVILINQSDREYFINVGDRIAQMVVMPIMQPPMMLVQELSPSVTRTGGLGSTGK